MTAPDRKEYNARYYAATAPQQREKAKTRRAADPKWERNKKFKRLYGITYADAEFMWEAQGRCCGLCLCAVEFPAKTTHVDHCHETKKVRGILCTRCNAGLGQFEDNPVLLRAAINYLRQHHA